MNDSLTDIVWGRDQTPQRTLWGTGVGLAIGTTLLLLMAQLVGPAWVALGGFLLLAAMTIALVVGAYHAYRNAGLVTSLAPITGVVAGVAAARMGVRQLGWGQPSPGLGTGDVAVILFAVGGLTAVGAYLVGIGWRKERT